MAQLTEKNVLIDRKLLSNVAVAFPEVFDKVYAEVVK